MGGQGPEGAVAPYMDGLSEQNVESATAKLNFSFNQLLNSNACVIH